MKKSYVIHFKELKNFYLFFDEVSIFYNSSNGKRLALMEKGVLICTVNLETTKLVHKNTIKDDDKIYVKFYLENI